MNKKSLVSIFLASSLVMGLAGCASDMDAGPERAEAEQARKDQKPALQDRFPPSRFWIPG